MRLHSIADKIVVPESIQELVSVIQDFKNRNQAYYLLSCGSNIVFNQRIITPIISLMKVDDSITSDKDGNILCGASVRIQKLIQYCKDNGLGGIEYLYSVPSSVGGAVYMNAGRGKDQGVAICDYLKSVKYLDKDDFEIKEYQVKKSDFSYRTSPFKNSNHIILSATFRFKKQDKTETERLMKERLDYSKKYLSADKPSCGSIFKQMNPVIMRLLRGKRIGGAMFSSKTSNWISNVDNASAEDIIALITYAKKIHSLFLQKCECEIIIMN